MRARAFSPSTRQASRRHRDANSLVDTLKLLVAPRTLDALFEDMGSDGLRSALWRPAVLVAGLAIVASSCSSFTESDRSITKERTSAASTTSAPQPAVDASAATSEQQAGLRAGVRAFWDLYLELGAKTGPFDAVVTRQRLAARTSGKELNRLLATFSSNAAAGYVVRGGIDVAPTVVSVDGTSAQVRDCYDDTTGLYRVSDGSRADTDDPNRHQVLMTLVLEGGTWKVSAITDEGTGCRG